MSNPFAYLKAAATGDLTAQRALANVAEQLVLSGAECDTHATLAEGLVFARLAAAHGHLSDQGRVICMLALAASYCDEAGSEVLQGEATARIAILADEGVEEAELLIATGVHNAPAQVMAFAQAFRTQMLEPEVQSQ